MATEIKLNTTIKTECTRIATIYKAKGSNWDAKASAGAIVRAILMEVGEVEAASSTEAEDIKMRIELINMILPFQTAPINVQRTTLAPLGIMPAVKSAAEIVVDDVA